MAFVLLCSVHFAVSPAAAVDFRRGDVDGDGQVTIGDPACMLGITFRGLAASSCQAAADVNGDGLVDISDAVYLTQYLYLAGPNPPPPFGTCGPDPIGALSCDAYDCSPPLDLPTSDVFTVKFGTPTGGAGDLEVPVLLEHQGAGSGASGWSLSIRALGASIENIVIDGTDVPDDAFTAFTDMVDSGEGAVVSVLTGHFGGDELPTNVTSTIALLTVRRDDPPTVPPSLVFEDGLQSGGGPPVLNSVVRPDECAVLKPVTESLDLPTLGPGCPGWGFSFGADPGVADHAITEDSFLICMTNAEEVLDFQLAVRTDGTDYTFEDGVLGDPGQLVSLNITDRLGLAHTPVTNRATGPDAAGRPVATISRAGDLLGFADDFYAFDLAPIVGGPGFTVAYVSDLSGVEFIPARGLVGGDCQVNEVLEIQFAPPPELTLQLDQDLELVLDAAEPETLVRLDAPEALGSAVRIALTDSDSLDQNLVYLGWGEPPTTTEFDLAGLERESSGQRVLIPRLRPQDGYLLVRAARINGASNVVTLRAERIEIAVDSVSTSSAARGDLTGDAPLHLAVTGSGFDRDTTYRLVHEIDGTILEPSRVAIISSTRAELELALSADASPGSYGLVAEALGGVSDTLEAAFSVEAREPGEILRVELSGDRYRFDRPARLSLRYENIGNREVPAPILLVIGPERSRLRLESEGRFEPWHDNTLQVLAVHAEGVAGRLSPGARGEIPIIYQVPFETGAEDAGNFRIFLFSPNRDDLVAWDRIAPASIPSGMPLELWHAAWPGYSVRLGARWVEYASAIADRATRLARRRVQPVSLRSSFRLATREVLGRSVSAVAGEVRDANSLAPLSGAQVVALEDDSVVATAVVTAAGRYALDGLQAGKSYTIRVKDHAPSRNLMLPRANDPLEQDLLGIDLEVVPQPDGLVVDPPAIDESALPDRPLLPPLDLFTEIRRQDLAIVRPIDPNCKDGPEGEVDELGTPRALRLGSELIYTIYFENDPDANAAALEVTVSDQLEPGLDPASFRMREVRVGEIVSSLDFPTEEGLTARTESYSGRALLRGLGSEGQWDAEVVCDYDPLTGEAQWTFRTIDPATAQPPLDAGETVGFLPPNTDSLRPRGDGSISFAVTPTPEVDPESELRNKATIQFETLELYNTREWLNVIGSFDLLRAPEFPFPGDGLSRPVEQDTPLYWSPSPDAESYEVVVFEDATGREVLRVEDVTENGLVLPADLLASDTAYRWQVTAVSATTRSDASAWTFRTVPPPPLPPPPSPSPDDRVADGAEGVPILPLLEWEDSGAPLYEVFLWVAGEERPEEPVAVVSEPRLAVPGNLEPGTAYLWEVVAGNRSGETIGSTWSFTTASAPPLPFWRGDVNQDRMRDISDAIAILSALFLGEFQIPCQKSADVDDSGVLDITDAVVHLTFNFLGEPDVLAEPFRGCGQDLSADALTCEVSGGCP